jgi:hypothetical protein
MNVRPVTTAVLDAIADGSLDRDYLIAACLGYLSEQEVSDMCLSNDIHVANVFEDDGDEDADEDDFDDFDDSMDGDHDSAMASAGWGTDEDYGSYGGDEY